MGVLSRLGLAALLVMAAVAPLAAQNSPRGPYRGRVIDASSAQPIAGAGVLLVWPIADDSGAASPFAYHEAQTDAQGQFSIDATTIGQTLPPRALPPQLWIYRPGYQLYPDRDVRPAGASAIPLTQPGATIQLLGARTDAERVEALNDFVAVINRYAPTGGPILLGLIESEFTRLKQVKPVAPTARSAPSPSVARGPCEVDPNNPPPLPPPKPPKIPAPGTYNPYEGRRAPYYGKVIDAETAAPLSGAAVVAVWSRRIVYPFHAHSVFHEACDVLTDRNGRFIVDSRSIEMNGPPGLEPPVFVVFLPGYSVYGVAGRRVSSGQPFVRGDSQSYHDVTVGLVKLKSREEQIDALGGIPYGPPADKIPRYQTLMTKEYERLWPRRR